MSCPPRLGICLPGAGLYKSLYTQHFIPLLARFRTGEFPCKEIVLKNNYNGKVRKTWYDAGIRKNVFLAIKLLLYYGFCF
jgi:hypothetical protein